MADKRPIDVYRDSALSATVGTAEEGAISEMISLKEDLLLVKERAIYSTKLADQIDPKRTNISIPKSIHQKLASVGSDSELVGRTILTAHALFRPNYVQQLVDWEECICKTLEIFKEIIALHELIERYLALQTKQIAAFPKTQKSFHLPSIQDVEAQVKAIISRAEHTIQKIYGLASQFYASELKKKGRFTDGLIELIHERYGRDDNFSKFIDSVGRFLKFIRNARHCIEHPGSEQKILVRDFYLKPSGEICPPTVEAVHDETPQPEIPVSAFIQQTMESLVYVTEYMIVELCAKHLRQSTWTTEIFEIEENQRRYKTVRFGYFIKLHGQWLQSS